MCNEIKYKHTCMLLITFSLSDRPKTISSEIVNAEEFLERVDWTYQHSNVYLPHNSELADLKIDLWKVTNFMIILVLDLV